MLETSDSNRIGWFVSCIKVFDSGLKSQGLIVSLKIKLSLCKGLGKVALKLS